MKKQSFYLAFLWLAIAYLFAACQKNNETDFNCPEKKVAADLFIKRNIITDSLTKPNLLIHNIRTGEILFGGENPVYGFELGDVLEIGVVITNYYPEDECSSGMDAPVTNTAAQAVRRSPSGQISNQNLSLAFTEAIKNGDDGVSIVQMQFNAPGDYYFNFEANSTRIVDEHNFENNKSGTYDGLTDNPNENRTIHIHIPATAAAATDDRSGHQFITEMPDSGTKAAFEKSKLVEYFHNHLKKKISIPAMPQDH